LHDVGLMALVMEAALGSHETMAIMT
jgi:hypothetical protein